MFTPKAFSIRSAISGDSDVFSFTRSESVARRTPSTSEAAVRQQRIKGGVIQRMQRKSGYAASLSPRLGADAVKFPRKATLIALEKRR
jgi:hypothetical protein